METAGFLHWQPFRCVLELLRTGLDEGRMQGESVLRKRMWISCIFVLFQLR